MESLWKDLKYALRMFIKSPGFTAVAVLSLALGIGANTTIFTLINSVFLQSLPVSDPQQLMAVFGTDEKNRDAGLQNFLPVSFPNYESYRDQNDVFSGLVAFTGAGMSIAGEPEPEQLNGIITTGNYFDVLGVKAALGRTFLPEDDTTLGTHPVVVISHSLWTRRFGANAAIVGQTIKLNNRPFTVIGVTPKGFRGTAAIGNVDFWLPMAMREQVLTGTFLKWVTERRALLFFIFGRLKPGVTHEQAEASMKTIGSRLEKDFPKENEKRNVTLMSLVNAGINPNQRDTFVMAGSLLMTVVGIVLLIACANIANLLLARASARRKEIAIRLALGATQFRLIRQLLTESILLALFGGGLGFVLAIWGRDLLMAFRPPFIPENGIDLSLDARVLAFTFAISVITGIIFGLVPALQATKPMLAIELKEGLNRTTRIKSGLRNSLVVSQIALSLVSLICGSLFLRSLRNAQQIDPGIDSEKLAVISFNVAAAGYDEARGTAFYRQVQERAASVPGVETAAISANPPFGGGFQRSIFIEGQEPPAGGRGILVLTNPIGLNYFATVGTPLLKGREFTGADEKQSKPVVIINEAMAKRFWPNQEAIGQRFIFFGDENPVEIVGIVRDAKYINIGEDPRPCVFLPLAQSFTPNVTLHVRTASPSAVIGTVRKEVQSLDPNLPLQNVETVEEVIGEALWAPRMGAALLGILGLLALLLAIVGIYGVLAYTVGQRKHEIGIRMALGARPIDVLALILKQGLGMVLIGIAIGLVGGFAMTRVIGNLLFSVSSADPLAFLATPLLLALVAGMACCIPAYKATRVDPLVALRVE